MQNEYINITIIIVIIIIIIVIIKTIINDSNTDEEAAWLSGQRSRVDMKDPGSNPDSD